MVNFFYTVGVLLFILLFILLFSIFIAIYARKAGYSFLLWAIVSFLCDPLSALFLLANLPDKKIEERRNKEMALLERQLAKRTFFHKGETSNVSEQTISDEKTIG
jgi:hypothetical protein